MPVWERARGGAALGVRCLAEGCSTSTQTNGAVLGLPSSGEVEGRRGGHPSCRCTARWLLESMRTQHQGSASGRVPCAGTLLGIRSCACRWSCAPAVPIRPLQVQLLGEARKLGQNWSGGVGRLLKGAGGGGARRGASVPLLVGRAGTLQTRLAGASKGQGGRQGVKVRVVGVCAGQG